MNTFFRKLIVITLIVVTVSDAYSQSRRRRSFRRSRMKTFLQHEVGGHLGVSNYQGDFKLDGPLDGLIQINGFTFGVSHYMHNVPRTYGRGSIMQHLGLKTSLEYTSVEYNNFGLGVTGNESVIKLAPDGVTPLPTNNDVLLGKITSQTSIISLNTQLEFFWFNLTKTMHSRRRSRNTSRFNPFAAVGFGVNLVNSEPTFKDLAEAEQHNINAGDTTLPGYPDNYDIETVKGVNSVVFSTNLAIGTRFQINRKMDAVAEMKVHLYFSDRVDALNPDLNDGNEANGIEGDKSTDYGTNINFGIVYHLF